MSKTFDKNESSPNRVIGEPERRAFHRRARTHTVRTFDSQHCLGKIHVVWDGG